MYLEINCVCLVILLLIYLNIHRHINKYLLDQKLFLTLVFANALILTLDSLMWLIDGTPGSWIRAVYNMVTVIYYVLNPLICALWYFYVDYYIRRSAAHLRKMIVPMLLPLFITLVLSCVSVHWNVLFSIDGNNIYHRGKFFIIMAAISFFFIGYTLGVVIANRKKLQAREFQTLLFFPAPPIIGGIIQTLFYGVSLIWVSATVSLLIIFINFQNDQLNTDFLTGLYNRRQLDDYLHSKCQNPHHREIAGLMIDLDSFKAINDTYGHDCGDRALKDVAEILKATFGKSDFVARFGGDEFVVIMETNERTDLDRAVTRLRENVARFNARKAVPYELSLSIGCDCYFPKGRTSANYLKHIDELMYADKQKTRGAENAVRPALR